MTVMIIICILFTYYYFNYIYNLPSYISMYFFPSKPFVLSLLLTVPENYKFAYEYAP